MGIILFNLKNYLDIDSSIKFAHEFRKLRTRHEIVIAPSMLSLFAFSKRIEKIRGINLCAQNLDCAADYGALTGDVIGKDLKRIGCKYVLIGHSEVRHRKPPRTEESDRLVAKKMRIAIDCGLIPVLCFGETKSERDSGKTEQVIKRQIRSALSEIKKSEIGKIVLAYEPVWAISWRAGAAACGVEYVMMVKKIVESVTEGSTGFRFIYGGSVNGENIGGYFSSEGVDGVLVGRAGTERGSLNKLISKV